MENQKGPVFFLGSSTKDGFVSLFGQLQNPTELERVFVLKGGPGSGKSTLMRRLGAALEERGHAVEWIACASDPDSLDAVLDRTARAAILDGTAPHVVDPAYPGAVETLVNAGDAWDEAALRANRGEIVALTERIAACHSRAGARIRAAWALLENNRVWAAPYVEPRAAAALAGKILEEVPEGSGRTETRLLSAVSVGRVAFWDGTLRALCGRLYVAEDPWGAGKQALLERLRAGAAAKGAETIVCPCSIGGGGNLDHLIFPAAGVGVSAANGFHAASHPGAVGVEGFYRTIPAWLREAMEAQREQAAALISGACECVAEAKALHDSLERFYCAAMDFGEMDELYDRLLAGMRA